MRLLLHTLRIALVLATMTNTLSAQWVKQTLPTTIGTPALEYPGAHKGAIGKNALWMVSRNNDGDSIRFGAVECIRTFDGGRTYRVSTLPFENIGYHYAIHVANTGTAYIASTSYETAATAIHRSVDSGATWQMLPYHPEGFLNAAIFYDANSGVAILDPDSLGAYFTYTNDGGRTFTRLPQTNVPRAGAHEIFVGGLHQIVGDVIFQPSLETETGEWRLWRSVDRGRNWTAGEWQEEQSPFGPNLLFTDKDNGFWSSGDVTPNNQAFYTTNGGQTWQPSTLPGIPSGGVLNSLPNTQNIIQIFEDKSRRMLFSAATNDFGKSWHSKKDLAPYKLDSIYVQFGLPAFGWTNLDIVDNNTAWAKFSQTELYRYDSSTPLIPEKPDLDLTITADNDGLPLWSQVKFTLTIKNRGISKATGIKANWLPPYKRTNTGAEPFANVGAYSSKGHYNWWTGDWNITELAAGESATATFHLFVVKNTANVTQMAQITACNESDLDSSPNNMTVTSNEDDEARFTSAARPTIIDNPNPQSTPSVASFLAMTSALKVSPNPAKDKAFVVVNDKTEAEWTLQVVNNTGQVVFTQTGQNSGMVEVKTEDLPNGLYFVHFNNGLEKKVEKLLVQH